MLVAGATAASVLSGLISQSEPALAVTLPASGSDVEARRVVTSKVFLDIEVCDSQFSKVTRMGDSSIFCSEGDSLGRIVIGLYGNHVPQIVSEFEQLAEERKVCSRQIFSRYCCCLSVHLPRQAVCVCFRV